MSECSGGDTDGIAKSQSPDALTERSGVVGLVLVKTIAVVEHDNGQTIVSTVGPCRRIKMMQSRIRVMIKGQKISLAGSLRRQPEGKVEREQRYECRGYQANCQTGSGGERGQLGGPIVLVRRQTGLGLLRVLGRVFVGSGLGTIRQLALLRRRGCSCDAHGGGASNSVGIEDE